jgi:hypothetical protein
VEKEVKDISKILKKPSWSGGKLTEEQLQLCTDQGFRGEASGSWGSEEKAVLH